MKPLPSPIHVNGFTDSDHLQIPQHPRQRSSSSHSYDSRSSSHEISGPPMSPLKPEPKEPKVTTHVKSKHRHRNDSKSRKHSHRHQQQHQQQALVNHKGHADVDENGHIYCEPASPRDVYSRNIPFHDSEPFECHVKVRRNPLDDNQEQGGLSVNIPSVANGPASLSNTLKGDSNINTKPESSQRTRGHRNNRYRELPCPTIYGTDISIEYNGKIPKRNTVYSLSRDSGVNCVGLTDTSGNLQSGKEKRLSGLNVLNNQTGTGSRLAGGSSSTTTLNNHNRTSFDSNLVMHQAQVHGTADYVSHSHQDSGFSSPRTDNEFAIHNTSSELFNSLPLNTSNHLSLDTSLGGHKNCLRSGSGKDSSTERKQLGNVQKSKEVDQSRDKENRLRHPAVSVESIPITSSEKYPSYGHLHSYDERDTNTTTSSSKSSSSKVTVLERPLQTDGHNFTTSHTPRSKGKGHISHDQLQSSLVKESPYMEIQAVPDCPLHGEQQRSSRNLADQKEDSFKRHSIAMRETKHHSGQWDHHRQSNHRYHSGVDPSTRKALESANRGQHGASDPRLAFLGDCEVVGIV